MGQTSLIIVIVLHEGVGVGWGVGGGLELGITLEMLSCEESIYL